MPGLLLLRSAPVPVRAPPRAPRAAPSGGRGRRPRRRPGAARLRTCAAKASSDASVPRSVSSGERRAATQCSCALAVSIGGAGRAAWRTSASTMASTKAAMARVSVGRRAARGRRAGRRAPVGERQRGAGRRLREPREGARGVSLEEGHPARVEPRGVARDARHEMAGGHERGREAEDGTEEAQIVAARDARRDQRLLGRRAQERDRVAGRKRDGGHRPGLRGRAGVRLGVVRDEHARGQRRPALRGQPGGERPRQAGARDHRGRGERVAQQVLSGVVRQGRRSRGRRIGSGAAALPASLGGSDVSPQTSSRPSAVAAWRTIKPRLSPRLRSPAR